MEGQSAASHSQYQYQWQRLVRRNTDTAPPPSLTTPSLLRVSPQLAHTQLELLPNLLPQHESYHQAQLAHYNKLLVSSTSVTTSARTTSGLQASPLPPLLSAQHIQAVPRTRSSSRGGITSKPNKSARVGHGNRDPRKSSKGDRAPVQEREPSTMMTMEKLDLTGKLPNRPLAHHQNSSLSHQSNSVPSTPLQHARKFSFDREPSPTAPNSHSPRSAYSESNIVLPPRPVNLPRVACKFETASYHFKRRMPYNLGTDMLDNLSSSKIKSNLTKDEERKLSTDMRELYDRLLPSPASEARREELVQKLEKSFNDEWPGHNIRVHVFGSSGNLLCTDDSDVDICITTDWKALESVCKIAELLAKNGMEKVVCVSNAKVPIVKMWDPKLDLACDMNVNNTLALENTRMVKTYIQIDPRVRELAMIIKHWTKQRILNDAAFGGTLSSYTWICMIINFLQTRNPPVLPNLQNRPDNRLPRPNGPESSFADDLDALRDFGEKNKETVGELLFGFFRFYGYEFDYENLVISVRQGMHISKTEKMWHLAVNNRLCVEEPFNTYRNLGNTADDTSFRGLHIELRRACDLISQGNLHECCEQYVFPEVTISERIFEKPVATKKPVLRSASQSSRGGRGNHRGGRNNNHQNNRNTSSNRRSSSSGHFDNAANFVPGAPPPLSHQEAWLQRQAQAQLHNDLYATYSVLQAQENNLRLQLYSQSQQQYLQVQGQAYTQSQGSSQGNPSGTKQQGERNRTSSFDQPPLSAPLRASDLYYYPFYHNPTYAYPTSNTNPSSPSLSNAVPELRRSVHRSSITNGSNNTGQGASALRSHSQPASRSNQSQMNMQAAGLVNHGLGVYQALRQVNGVPRSSADENVDSSIDPSLATVSSSPEDNTPKEYVGYYVNDSALAQPYRPSLMPMAIPAYKQGRRRESQEFAQSIMDRIKRPSRSPSPLGHDRSYSIGTLPGQTASIPIRQSISSTNLKDFTRMPPPVVGSNVPAPISIPQWQASMCEGSVSEDFSTELGSTSLESSSQFSTGGSDVGGDKGFLGHLISKDLQPEPRHNTPMVVNGSNPVITEPFAEVQLPTQNGIPAIPTVYQNGVSAIPSVYQNGFKSAEYTNGNGSLRSSPTSRSKVTRQTHNGVVPSIDVGLSQIQMMHEDLPYLSPVYETQTPSPRTIRKFEPVLEPRINVTSSKNSNDLSRLPPLATKVVTNGHEVKSSLSLSPHKLNGHNRGSKSEGGNSNAWQKAGNKKKKGISAESTSSGNGQPLSEKPPRKESERRGG